MPTILTTGGLYRELEAAGYPADRFGYADKEYSSVSHADIRDLWSAWVDSLPEELRTDKGRPIWIAGVWDCDNHAHSFVEWITRSHALTFQLVETPARRGGLAVGVWWYTAAGSLDRIGGHAACLVRDARGISAFEPASGEVFEPNEHERASTRRGVWI